MQNALQSQLMLRLTKDLLFRNSAQKKIEDRLRNALKPIRLQVVNESHLHSRGTDTHFNLLIVSPVFQNLNKVKQHQLVYSTLGDIMKEIHALTITCYPAETEQAEAWSLDCFHRRAK